MRRIATAIAAALAATAAQGSAPPATLESSPALRCLSPPAAARGGPEYPFVAWKARREGRFKVELRFDAPDRRPEVTVLEQAADALDGDDFLDAIRSHARQLRVPCLEPGQAPLRLVQHYVFRPDSERVAWSHPVDANDAERRALLRCIAPVAGGAASPSYPPAAQRAGLQGRVLVRLRFDAPDRPPGVQAFARNGSRPLVAAVEAWAMDLRMPCHTGAPIESVWTLIFVFEGEAYGFKPLTLTQFLPHVKDIAAQTLAVDTATMGCPFDLRFQYRLPHLSNAVGEVGGSVATRRPLLDWLAGAELDLPRPSLDAVYGDETTITVPCLKIDLKPKENS